MHVYRAPVLRVGGPDFYDANTLTQEPFATKLYVRSFFQVAIAFDENLFFGHERQKCI